MNFIRIIVILTCVGVAQVSGAQNDDVIARVIIAGGTVQAERDGEIVSLTRRSEIFVGDKITTALDGSVQIRFIDNAILSLSCDSEILIRDYQYLDRNNDRAELHLIKGQMRTVTGVIQRRNTRLTTDRVEIRPTGTDYELLVTEDAEYYGVYDGNIRVSSLQAENEIEIGNSTQAQYAVYDSNGMPTPMALRPAQLGTGALGSMSCE